MPRSKASKATLPQRGIDTGTHYSLLGGRIILGEWRTRGRVPGPSEAGSLNVACLQSQARTGSRCWPPACSSTALQVRVLIGWELECLESVRVAESGSGSGGGAACCVQKKTRVAGVIYAQYLM